MSDSPVYFQWQNPFLLQTIYPLRELKLRDFLVYFYELETWEDPQNGYKKKNLADLADEVQAYQRSHQARWQATVDSFAAQQAYFLRQEIQPEHAAALRLAPEALDGEELTFLQSIHKEYAGRMAAVPPPTLRREFIYLSGYQARLNTRLAELRVKLSELERKQRNTLDPVRQAAIGLQVQQFKEVRMAMTSQELAWLNTYLDVFGKVEKQRNALQAELPRLQARQGEARKERERLLLLKREKRIEARIKQRSIQRLEQPNARQVMLDWLHDTDIAPDLQAEFGEDFAEVEVPWVVTSINNAHSWLRGKVTETGGEANLNAALPNYLKLWTKAKDGMDNLLGRFETTLMRDYVDLQSKSAAQLQALIQQRRVELQALEAELPGFDAQIEAAKQREHELEAQLALDPQAQLRTLSTLVNVTKNDLARQRVESYRAALAPADLNGRPGVAQAAAGVYTQLATPPGQAPRFVPTGGVLAGKTLARGSVLRLASSPLRAADGADYYPVVLCPALPAAAGGFVRADELRLVDLEVLLELVVDKLLEQPGRYPLWLAYMVVHFSGMRYQSAHGSWADPRDLLNALSERLAEAQVGSLSDEALEAVAQQRLAWYDELHADQAGGTSGGHAALPADAPKLLRAEEPGWAGKAAEHMQKLRAAPLQARTRTAATAYQPGANAAMSAANLSPIPAGTALVLQGSLRRGETLYYRVEHNPVGVGYSGLYLADDDLQLLPNAGRRKALLDLLVDETDYVNATAPELQVLAVLSQAREQLQIPDWAWNEVVRLTNLRLHHPLQNLDEALQPSEEEQRAASYPFYRQLLNTWKQENLAEWRLEHERRHQLVVTRAVCNEVAEHIQHLRGHKAAAGLTAKGDWYLRRVRDSANKPPAQRSVFIKPQARLQDFPEGASILWLRFVESQPNQWRVAHPLRLPDGSGLLEPAVRVYANSLVDKTLKLISQGLKTTSDWIYYMPDANRYKRARQVVSGEQRQREEQWLRWMHEATVAAVGETADGPVVLTFETALPYEDPRRSTIGVTRHDLSTLAYRLDSRAFIGSFVGWNPPSHLPMEDLKVMLNWEHILRQPLAEMPVERQARAAAYWAFWEAEAARLAAPAAPGTAGGAAARPRPEGVRAEVCFPPPAQGNSEEISAYAFNATQNTMTITSPRVTLRRGVRLNVDREAPQKARLNSKELTFYAVTRCESEGRAVDLYVLADQVIVLPAPAAGEGEPGSKAMICPDKISLRTVYMRNQNGLPVVELYKGKDAERARVLRPQSAVRVSTVQWLTKGNTLGQGRNDRGDGVIECDADADFDQAYVIVEAPGYEEIIGAFVPVKALQPLEETEYLFRAAEAARGASEPLRARTRLPAEGERVFLFERLGQAVVRSPLPAIDFPLEVVLDPLLLQVKEKQFYRIQACEPRPEVVGRYLNLKDVEVVLRLPVKMGTTLFEGEPGEAKAALAGVLIPAGTELLLDPVPEFVAGRGFYRLLAPAPQAAWAGKYVAVEAVG